MGSLLRTPYPCSACEDSGKRVCIILDGFRDYFYLALAIFSGQAAEFSAMQTQLIAFHEYEAG